MKKIIFDITHLVEHLKRNKNLTGIQRVELNVISGATRILGENSVFALIQDSDGKNYRIVETTTLLKASLNQSPLESIINEAMIAQSVSWPDKVLVKSYLDKFKRNKAKRALEKAKIYCYAIVKKEKLIALGMLPNPREGLGTTTAPLSLHNTDIYVNLGAAWGKPNSHRIAKEHHKSGGTTVQMVHDLIPIVMPHLHMGWVHQAFAKWLTKVAPVTNHFLCVSKNTKKDLSAFLEKNRFTAEVSTTLLAHEFYGFARGAKVELDQNANTEIISLRGTRFISCIGSIEMRKNCDRLINAWITVAKSNPQHRDITLVFAGKKSWGTSRFEESLAEASAAGIKVKVIESASDHDIAWLYSHSLFTAYLSFYEGWGLPVGESLWFNTPCLASHSSSIPEVGGDLVQYCDPNSTQSVVAGLLHLLDDKHLSEYRTKITHTPLRSWADHVKDVLTAVLGTESPKLQ